jgi:hypothetical protein
MSKVLIWINTYKRDEMLDRLLKQIDENSGSHEVSNLIIGDGYRPNINTQIYKNRTEICTYSENCGKKNYWKLINYGIGLIRDRIKNIEYVIKIDDDMEVAKDFLDRAIFIWDSIPPETNKIAMDILSLKKQRGRTLTGEKCTPTTFNGDSIVYNTNWIDMNFICNELFFGALNYSVPPTKANKNSSCVGIKITRILNNRGYTFWQSDKSLLKHGNHTSVMHGEYRNKNPLT